MQKISRLINSIDLISNFGWDDITGIPPIDRLITPSCQAGNLIIIGSTKHGGKTMLAL